MSGDVIAGGPGPLAVDNQIFRWLQKDGETTGGVRFRIKDPGDDELRQRRRARPNTQLEVGEAIRLDWHSSLTRYDGGGMHANSDLCLFVVSVGASALGGALGMAEWHLSSCRF